MNVYLKALNKPAYSQPLDLLSGASLGQHTRHILEFFQCLVEQAPSGTINYDARNRASSLEQDPTLAALIMKQLLEQLQACDLELSVRLDTNFSTETTDPAETVQSSFGRELVYNIEHTIHHLALIRIGLKALCPELTIPEGFGVAPSSIRFRQTQPERLPSTPVASHP